MKKKLFALLVLLSNFTNVESHELKEIIPVVMVGTLLPAVACTLTWASIKYLSPKALSAATSVKTDTEENEIKQLKEKMSLIDTKIEQAENAYDKLMLGNEKTNLEIKLKESTTKISATRSQSYKPSDYQAQQFITQTGNITQLPLSLSAKNPLTSHSNE